MATRRIVLPVATWELWLCTGIGDFRLTSLLVFFFLSSWNETCHVMSKRSHFSPKVQVTASFHTGAVTQSRGWRQKTLCSRHPLPWISLQNTSMNTGERIISWSSPSSNDLAREVLKLSVMFVRSRVLDAWSVIKFEWMLKIRVSEAIYREINHLQNVWCKICFALFENELSSSSEIMWKANENVLFTELCQSAKINLSIKKRSARKEDMLNIRHTSLQSVSIRWWSRVLYIFALWWNAFFGDVEKIENF